MNGEVKRLSPFRLLSIYAYEALGTGHNMYAQIEFDVTGIRQGLRAQREEGRNITFWGFLLSAIAKTIDENKELNQIRRGKNLYCFDEIDICIPIEWKIDGTPAPRPYIIRDAGKKTAQEITREIEDAKTQWKQSVAQDKPDKWAARWLKSVAFLPPWLIRFLIRQGAKNPYEMKKRFGTTYVASLSGFTDVPGFILPYFEGQNRPLAFAVGNVVKKPGVVGAEVQVREYLSMTISFNHDLVDGAPSARFVNRLKSRIEGARED